MSVASPPQPRPAAAVPLVRSRDEVRQRVLAKLLEKHDAARAKHKPLSLQRAELRKHAEQLLDAESGPPGGSERERLLEELLGEVPGFGPLDELFRDETLKEFLILAHNQVIRRGTDNWLPTSVQFRDLDHYRSTLKKLLQSATPIGDVPKTSDGGADALLPNGFRVIAILPPRVMNLAPTAIFRRSEQPATIVEPTPAPRVPAPAPAAAPPPPKSTVDSGPQSVTLSRILDPWERNRNRVTARLVQKLASNGVNDISGIPTGELRRVIAAYVTEFNEVEKWNLDNAAQDRLTLEILAAMPR